jgi:hypothetical protein
MGMILTCADARTVKALLDVVETRCEAGGEVME